MGNLAKNISLPFVFEKLRIFLSILIWIKITLVKTPVFLIVVILSVFLNRRKESHQSSLESNTSHTSKKTIFKVLCDFMDISYPCYTNHMKIVSLLIYFLSFYSTGNHSFNYLFTKHKIKNKDW